jgi:hypothetical protein
MSADWMRMSVDIQWQKGRLRSFLSAELQNSKQITILSASWERMMET